MICPDVCLSRIWHLTFTLRLCTRVGFSATIIGSENLPNRDHNVGKQMPMMMKMMLTINPPLRPVIPAVRFEVFEKCGDAKMKAF